MSPFPNDDAHKIYCDRVTYASMEKPSTHDTASRATSRIGKIELPWLILAALLISTLLAAFQSSRQLRADADMRFAEIAQGEKRTLIRQLRDVDNILQGARAFHKALPNLSQSAWDTYIATRLRDVTSNAGLIAIDGRFWSETESDRRFRTDQRRARFKHLAADVGRFGPRRIDERPCHVGTTAAASRRADFHKQSRTGVAT